MRTNHKLTRLARSQVGALVLLENGIFHRLSEKPVLSQRPVVTSGTTENAPIIKDIPHRFHQILFPALLLSNTPLSDISDAFLTFPQRHIECDFTHLELSTCVFPVGGNGIAYRRHFMSGWWNAVYEEFPGTMEVRGELSCLEQVTLNLLLVYIYGENILDKLGLVSSKVCLQVAVNILKLARALTTQNRAIFASSFDLLNKSCLFLRILIKTLVNFSTILINAQENSEICRHRLDSIRDLTTQQLIEVISIGFSMFNPLCFHCNCQDMVLLWRNKHCRSSLGNPS